MVQVFDFQLCDRPTKREVALKKQSGEAFGASLCSILGGVYVMNVKGHTKHGIPPAYRAGLRFGDRITAVNGTIIHSADNVIEKLDEADEVVLDIKETPFYSSIFLSFKRGCSKQAHNTPLGFDYDHKYGVCSVDPESAAALSGLQEGTVIVQIGRSSTLGLPAREIVRRLEKARNEEGSFFIVTCPMREAQFLFNACVQTMVLSGQTRYSVAQYINQTLRLDDDLPLEVFASPLPLLSPAPANNQRGELSPRSLQNLSPIPSTGSISLGAPEMWALKFRPM
eukprot:comp33068_c0_seq1/m.47274 comp33068_c0_seq1/g.47274  ORF comp33068_c0_seq1/g.47274 comp33068_c0_seq1/m.47274 type:complete len:282 (-) comp33068_c0_seq1:328-1173(-)